MHASGLACRQPRGRRRIKLFASVGNIQSWIITIIFFYLLPEFVSLNVAEWFCRQPQPCANARCWEFNHNKPAKRLKVLQIDPRWWFSSIEFIGQYVVKHTSAVASKLGDESARIPRSKTRHSRRHFNTNWDNVSHCKCQATCV